MILNYPTLATSLLGTATATGMCYYKE